jgi:hypothetical protein
MATLSLKTAADGNSGSIQFGGVDALTVTANTVAMNGLMLTKTTISDNSTIPDGFNALSTGPITIATDKQVIVSGNSRWVIV